MPVNIKKMLLTLALAATLACVGCESVDIKVQINGGTSSAPESSESTPPVRHEKAEQAFREVLENRQTVFWVESNEYLYLGECRFPYVGDTLGGVSHRMTSVDLDGDTIPERVIGDGDMVVLRYVSGTIYVYPFVFREMDCIYTDGTIAHHDDDGQGLRRLRFDAYEVKIEDLCYARSQEAVDTDAKKSYFIAGKPVTETEYHAYLDTLCDDEVTWERITVPQKS